MYRGAVHIRGSAAHSKTLEGQVMAKFRMQKVGTTYVVPVTIKILIIFVCMLLFSTLSSSFVLITLSQRQVINLTNTIMVDKLKELYTNAENQWQIYQYSRQKDECLSSLCSVAMKGFQMKHSIALGVDVDGNIPFVAKQENADTKESAISGNTFSDTEALSKLNENAAKGVYEGSIVFDTLQGEYFGVYKWHDDWQMYFVRAEAREDTQREMWRLFAINTIIIAVMLIAFAIVGVKLLQHVLNNIQSFTDDIFDMQGKQKLSLIDLSKAPNDDITYMAASFNSLSSSISNLINTFQKFVSKDVAAKAYEEHGIALEGSQKELTILFSDIKSFTFRTETLGNEIINLLNVHYNRVIRRVHENKGVIGSIIGDAVLAIFGTIKDGTSSASQGGTGATPQEIPEAQKSLDAVQSAWQITAVTAALRSSMEARKKEIEKERSLSSSEEKVYQAVLLDVGVGIDGGTVFYGNIGSSEHMANTVIGDNVNSASRLEGLTRVYHLPVIVSEYIKNEVESITSRYRFYEIDTVQVKGKTQGKKIFFPLDTQAGQLLLDGSSAASHKTASASSLETASSSGGDGGGEVYKEEAFMLYEKALAAYYAGKWKEARKCFKECKVEAAQVFLDRMGMKGAPEGWNGIWTMTSK